MHDATMLLTTVNTLVEVCTLFPVSVALSPPKVSTEI